MRLGSFLSLADLQRAARTLARLQLHNTASFVLIGGFSIEPYLRLHGIQSPVRPLNDIDFLVHSFDQIPKTLAGDFLMRHVHPHALPATTLMQCVDPQTALRVDVFRACGNEIARAQPIELDRGTMRIAALEDLVAHLARLCLDLAGGTSAPAKHARHLLQLLPLVSRGAAECVWPEHRKPDHPGSFAEAAALLSRLIPLCEDLQIDPVYSQDADAACPRCRLTKEFPLADPRRILSLLGYC